MASLSNVTDALVAGRALLEDPALPEVTRLVIRLRDLEGAGGKVAAGQTGRGIGLKHAVGPLRMYIRVREQPALGIALAAGILAIPFIAGFIAGRSARR